MILRVFIVEDEEMIRKGLVHTINWSDMGCLVVGSAADGRSGLSGIVQKRPDVVITDIRMPEMDGLEAARQIRLLARQDAKRVPIIAMTADVFPETVQQCLEAGMNAHIGKPIDAQLLYRLLLQILRPPQI